MAKDVYSRFKGWDPDGKDLDQVHDSPVVQPGLTCQAQNSQAFLTVPLTDRAIWTRDPGAQHPDTWGPRPFLSVHPSAGHMAKAETLISAETNPAASLHSLSVNRLQEVSHTAGGHPKAGPPLFPEVSHCLFGALFATPRVIIWSRLFLLSCSFSSHTWSSV